MSEFLEWADRLAPDAPDGVRRPYRTYREHWQAAAAVVRAYPGGVAARAYGHSAEGEPLWSLTVGAGEPTVLVVANLHAMEHVGAATAIALLGRAAAGEAGWGARRLVVAPLANPDGFRAVERALAAGRRRFLRKNARGVDLNRNFAEGWDPGYYLNRVLRGVFAPGPAPLSEPETAALDALAAACRPTFAVSLHAFGEWIYVPWAGRREPPPDAERLLAVAGEMAARQPHRAYRVLQLARRNRLFAARGAEIDHFYARHGALSFLIEIGAGPRLREPSGWLHPYRWFSPPAATLERDVENVLPALDVLARA